MGRDEGIGVDLSAVGKKLGKLDKGKIALLLFLLVPIFLSVYFRVQPAYLPVARDWAERGLYSNIRAGIISELDVMYPNLPQANKERMAGEELQKIIEQGYIEQAGQRYAIEAIINDNEKYLKEKFQNEDGGTYLLAIDPYFYYRRTQNMVENGHAFDYVDENGRYHDTKILAGRPLDSGQPRKADNLHTSLQALMYRAVRLFNPDASLMNVVFFSPVILGTLAVIPAFFLARRVAGNAGGFFAAAIVAIHPAFLSRTAGGFSDTDAYNVFFPLMVVWLVMLAFDQKDTRKMLLYSGLAGLCTGLFSFAWQGWFFVLDFVLAMLAAVFVYNLAAHREYLGKNISKLFTLPRIRNSVVVTASFLAASAVFVAIFVSHERFIAFARSTLRFTQIKEVGTLKVWPNVLTTVAELNPANLQQVLAQISMGSSIWLLAAFAGLVLPLYAGTRGRKESGYMLAGSMLWYVFLIAVRGSVSSHILYSALIALPVAAWVLYLMWVKADLEIKYSIILAVWFAATIYASSKGVRFILLLVPAAAIAIGITVGLLTKWLSGWAKEAFEVRWADAAVFLLFFVLLFMLPTNFTSAMSGNVNAKPSALGAAYATALGEIPSMNDDWYAALAKIRDESEPDAIINSWWDFGHWFAAIGERAVTLDGGRQNNPQAHWLGKLMLTWDEDESVGILRYLDCGSNTGFDRLYEYMGEDNLRAISTLYEIIPQDRDTARRIILDAGIGESEAGEVLRYTHCEPPENYFITSEDMVGKSGVWAHFGSWNFTRAVMYNQVHDENEEDGIRILQEGFGHNASSAEKLYWEIVNANPDRWISPWPAYAGSTACTVTGDVIACNNGIVFDMAKEEFTIDTGQGIRHPHWGAYIKDNEFRIQRYSEDTINLPQTDRPLGVAIVPQGNSYVSVMMDGALTGSMFTRLFYYENQDRGLRHFEKFHEVTDVTGQKIIVWKVDWDGMALEDAPLDKTDEQAEEDSAGKPMEDETDTAGLVRLEHILVSTEERSIEDALALAEDIRSRVSANNFTDALAESECESDCELPWISEGAMPGFDAAFGMEVGEISEPVLTDAGYEIFLVTAKK